MEHSLNFCFGLAGSIPEPVQPKVQPVTSQLFGLSLVAWIQVCPSIFGFEILLQIKIKLWVASFRNFYLTCWTTVCDVGRGNKWAVCSDQLYIPIFRIRNYSSLCVNAGFPVHVWEKQKHDTRHTGTYGLQWWLLAQAALHLCKWKGWHQFRVDEGEKKMSISALSW